jgi:hypothetical protein
MSLNNGPSTQRLENGQRSPEPSTRRSNALVHRVGEAIAADTRRLGESPFADGDIGRSLGGVAATAVGGAVSYLKATGRVRTVVRSIDPSDPRLAGRKLRGHGRALVAIDAASIAQPESIRADPDFAGQAATLASEFHEAVATARQRYRDGLALLEARATVARLEARGRQQPAEPIT